MVYGHNFPAIEPYIYSFHVPLFFLISGIFHPKKVDYQLVKKRFKMIMLPYFVWASLLFLFWLFLGRRFGDSEFTAGSVTDNIIGIFYAQGGGQYMEWGIPLWFLPCIFVLFLCYSGINTIQKKWQRITAIIIAATLGFIWPVLTGMHLPWSIDVALVATAFYGTGHLMSDGIKNINRKQALMMLPIFLAIGILAFYFNPDKVDMYRSQYGNQLLFLASGIGGSLAVMLFFRIVPVFRFLSYIGRHTIVILATHLRAMTLIKAIMVFVFGIVLTEFTELEKFGWSIAQIIIVIPVIWIVNKYAPILDGKIKKP